MNILKYILILTCLLFSFLPASTGQDITPPDRPMITHVTVDTATENTLIYWTESSSDDVEWYYIYYEIMTVNGLEGVKLDSVPPGNSVYVHDGNAGDESLIYSISAIDSSGNETVRTPGYHSTIHVDLDYDSCFNAMDISWNSYTGWGDNISGYRIYSRTEGEPYGAPEGVGKGQNSIRLNEIQANTQYYFYVEALKNDTFISTSAIEPKYTYMPGAPSDFRLLSVDAVSDNSVRINFEFTDTSSVDDFRLMRSISKEADFITLKSRYDLNSGENYFTDSIVTGTDSYFYKIGSLNSCNHVITESNVGNNILLQGENTGNYNELNWNFYEDWETGVAEYQILTYSNEGNSQIIHTSAPGVNDYSHDLTNIYGTGFEGVISYRVIAKKNGENIYSQSNILEIDLSSNITVPNAFTPNNDGINDTFEPYFSVIPRRYVMLIYDRNGIIIFRTENPEVGWDGRINSGGMATEGVYLYHIQYTSHTGTVKEETGHLTVFYP